MKTLSKPFSSSNQANLLPNQASNQSVVMMNALKYCLQLFLAAWLCCGAAGCNTEPPVKTQPVIGAAAGAPAAGASPAGVAAAGQPPQASLSGIPQRPESLTFPP